VRGGVAGRWAGNGRSARAGEPNRQRCARTRRRQLQAWKRARARERQRQHGARGRRLAEIRAMRVRLERASDLHDAFTTGCSSAASSAAARRRRTGLTRRHCPSRCFPDYQNAREAQITRACKGLARLQRPACTSAADGATPPPLIYRCCLCFRACVAVVPLVLGTHGRLCSHGLPQLICACSPLRH
jgi:hypothetical protein